MRTPDVSDRSVNGSDCIAVRVLAVVAFSQCSLCMKVSRSAKVVFRAYKPLFEILVRRRRRYVKHKAHLPVIL